MQAGFLRLSIIVVIMALPLLTGFYQPPVVSHDVHVMQNATPSQCTNYKGHADPVDDAETFTRFGEDTSITGPGIRTCRGCQVDPQSQDCVCKTCYDYYN